MPTPTFVEPGTKSGTAADPLVIGKGTQGIVTLDTESMTVCKEFHAPALDRAARASENEFMMLDRLHRRLRDEKYLTCPEPLRVDPSTGSLYMTYCPGERLDNLLYDQDSPVHSHMDHIAEQLAIAADHYDREFGKPFYGLSAHNTLFDAETGVVCVLDLHTSLRLHDTIRASSPVEVGLARCIGTALFDSVRPKTFSHRSYASTSVRFLAVLIARFRARHHVDVSTVVHLSKEVIAARLSRLDSFRRLWFRLIGRRLLDRRMRLVLEEAERFAPRVQTSD